MGYSSACARDTAAVGGLFCSLGSEDSAEPSSFALAQAVQEVQGKTSAQF